MSVGLALLVALQLAAVSAEAPLAVRVGDRTGTVPVVRGAEGTTVALETLARALDGRVTREATDRVRLTVGSGHVDFRIGSAFAVGEADTSAMPFATTKQGRDIMVPVMVVTDLLPRLRGANLLFDVERREIRRFAKVVAPPRPARMPIGAPAPGGSTGSDPVGGIGAASRPVSLSGRQRVVVVDAGHGGPDNGMVGPIGAPVRVPEKAITLAVAQAVRRALEAQGVQVVMTRATDTLIALGDRGRIANRAKGDVFVSIHVNAANPRWANPAAARGFETYFLAEAKTEDERRVAAMENEAIRFETEASTSSEDPLGFIIRDMAQNEHLRESSRLAELIQGGMKPVHPGPDRGVKQAGFMVLVSAFMPAVLVEIGFGSNRAESAYLTDPARQAELGSRIADGVVRYLTEYERKVGGG